MKTLYSTTGKAFVCTGSFAAAKYAGKWNGKGSVTWVKASELATKDTRTKQGVL
tara:strand:+ start:887 stop:1048 length:162 start_codon:yes stop_codon:yes gene_type:complete